MTTDTERYLILGGIAYCRVSEAGMARPNAREADDARRDALAWLAKQEHWEDRLAELRRPRGGRPTRSRGPKPPIGLRRAG